VSERREAVSDRRLAVHQNPIITSVSAEIISAQRETTTQHKSSSIGSERL
jgi:hypothetical protein